MSLHNVEKSSGILKRGLFCTSTQHGSVWSEKVLNIEQVPVYFAKVKKVILYILETEYTLLQWYVNCASL